MGYERVIASGHLEGPSFNLEAKLRHSDVMFQNKFSSVYSFGQTNCLYATFFKCLEAEIAVTYQQFRFMSDFSVGHKHVL
jgi:hypothetical protein